MVFSSLLFLFVYLPVVLGTYYLLFLPSQLGTRGAPLYRRASNAWLLLASLFFYSWGDAEVLWIMVTMLVVNYACGLAIARARARAGETAASERPRGRRWVVLALVANLGLLGFFKYANFGVENFNALMAALGMPEREIHDFARIALPLGISFYTFQSLSYTIDVYRGTVAPTKSLLNFACYKTMFPQLVAGPIVRYVDVAHELVDRTVSWNGAAKGATRFCLGLAKKVLVANTVAVPADAVFGLPTDQLTAGHAWLGIVCYALQIYFDFSAYSDMAIGLGWMMGFHFNENFRYPYVARSNQDFWRRWHISLSTWFRDYLYIPLGGNKGGAVRTYANLALVFFLCGLWHGASWTFVVWGLYHGFFLIVERLGLGALLERLLRPAQHAYLLVVALGGWVLFRADTLPQAAGFYGAMAGFGTGTGSAKHLLETDLLIALVAGCLFATPVVPAFTAAWQRWQAAARPAMATVMAATSAIWRPALLATLFYGSAMALSAGTHNPFIYFRF